MILLRMELFYLFARYRQNQLEKENADLREELEDVLREIANDDFADNLCKAINEGEDDGWEKTDMAFYKLEPSLTTFLEAYVEANKDVIFD